MKKFISLFLIFSLIMLSVNLYAKQKRGATLIITKKNYQQIKGELITVKENSLLVLDTEGKDVSVDIKDIKVIEIKKKSKAVIGFLAGGITGAILGYASYKKRTTGNGIDVFSIDIDFGPAGRAILGGILLGAIGSIIGAQVEKAETIQFEGITEFEIWDAMEELRKRARIRDYK